MTIKLHGGTTPVAVKGKTSKGSKAPASNANLIKLGAALTVDRARIQGMGGKPKKGGPSTLSRVFDVLSRPVYAGAEATSRFWEGKSLENVAEGAVGGLAGKNKTHYAEAIQRGADAGNTLLKPVARNRVAKAITGLAGDLILDPTMYLGGELIKPLTASAKETINATKLAAVGEDITKGAEIAAHGARATKLAEVTPGTVGSHIEELSKLIADSKIAKAEALAPSLPAAIPATERAVVKAAVTAKREEVTAKAVAAGIHKSKRLLPLSSKLYDKIAAAALETYYKGEMTAAKVAGKTAAKTATEDINFAEKLLKGQKVAKGELKLPGLKNLQGSEVSAAMNAAHAAEVATAKADAIITGIVPELASDPLRLAVKFAGKTLATPSLGGLEIVGKLAGKSETLQAVNRAFRPTATYKDGTNVVKRTFESIGASEFTKKAEEVGNVFKGMHKDDLRKIGFALEDPALAHALPQELHAGYDYAKEVMADLLAKEQAHLIQRGEPLKNYAYHYYRKGSRALQREFKDIRRGAGIGGGTGKTLLEAEAAGLKPVVDVKKMLELRLAKHQSEMIHSNIINAITKEFGVKAGSKITEDMLKGRNLAKFEHPYMGLAQGESRYFPENVQKSLATMNDLHTNARQASELMKHFDQVQGQWKFFATAANPGHHLRNLFGDTWMNYLDGVHSAEPYKKSMEILWGKLSPETIAKMSPEAKAAFEKAVADGVGATARDVKVTVHGHSYTGKDILDWYERTGSRSGMIRTEIESGSNKIMQGIRKFAEKREDTTRLAHFIDAFRKEAELIPAGLKRGDAAYEKALEAAAHRSAMRVRKWNIDYGDLTEFEKGLKRAIPFYTFMRKNAPLQLEALALKPGKIATIPKSMLALQQLAGQGTEQEDDIPGWASVPKWIKEMAPIHLSGEGEGKSSIYWAPPLPFMEPFKYAEGGGQGILQNITSQFSPAIKAPVELATGRQLFSGAPVGSWKKYGLGQIPLTRIAGETVTGTDNGAVGGLSNTKLINYLTGAGLQESTPARQAGELRRQQDLTQAQVKQLKAKLMKNAGKKAKK